jgi:hypothetical protein
MNPMNKILSFMALYVLVTGPVGAQQQATPAAAPADPAATADPAAPAQAAKPPKQTAQSEAGEPRADTSKSARAPGESKPAVKSAPKIDRLDLGTATVTGDREQPKVMYIVPWKRSDIGDLAGKPMNSLVDEILAPVDRDVFKREVVYYHAVQADASQNGASAQPSQQGEK